MLKLNQATMDISRFTHVPKLPGGVFGWSPIIALSVIALALLVSAPTGFRGCDLTI